MRQKSGPVKESAEKVVKDIRRATRRHFSAEDKIRIVLEGLRGEESIAELCRREGIVQNLYYRRSKDFLEAGKKRPAGDTARAATSDEVKDLAPRPDRVWSRIPDVVREQIIKLALDEPALSPRELALRFTDTEDYFVSEASIYSLLKGHDLIASPAFIVMKAADEFKDKTTAPNELWQTDFTYLKVI